MQFIIFRIFSISLPTKMFNLILKCLWISLNLFIANDLRVFHDFSLFFFWFYFFSISYSTKDDIIVYISRQPKQHNNTKNIYNRKWYLSTKFAYTESLNCVRYTFLRNKFRLSFNILWAVFLLEIFFLVTYVHFWGVCCVFKRWECVKMSWQNTSNNNNTRNKTEKIK